MFFISHRNRIRIDSLDFPEGNRISVVFSNFLENYGEIPKLILRKYFSHISLDI